MKDRESGQDFSRLIVFREGSTKAGWLRRKSERQEEKEIRRGGNPAGDDVWLCFSGQGRRGWSLRPMGRRQRPLSRWRQARPLHAIGRQLEAAGVVRSRYAFDLVRLFEHGTLRAGEYRFDHPAPVTEVYARIARGDVFTIAVTIPEGANIFDIAARVEQAGLGTRTEHFLAARGQTNLIADLDPAAKSLEGYLFPDTYRFPPPHGSADCCHHGAAIPRRGGATGTDRECAPGSDHGVAGGTRDGRGRERPLVASVFENRLAKNMPLRTDPSVIYGLELEGRWRGTIYAERPDARHALQHLPAHGLPPGPVATRASRRCAPPWSRPRPTIFTLWRREPTRRASRCLRDTG